MLATANKLLIELRDDAAVSAIVSTRVRVFEPAPGDAGWTTDVLTGDKTYNNAFVVIVQLASPRAHRNPVQAPRFAVRCYGRTVIEADDLYRACSDAIHETGPRLYANGLGIYHSHDDTGGNAEKDPDTGQPYMTFIVELLATAQAVTA